MGLAHHRAFIAGALWLLSQAAFGVHAQAFKVDYWQGGMNATQMLQVAQKHDLSVSPDCVHAFYGYDHARATYQWGQHRTYCYFDSLLNSGTWVQLSLGDKGVLKAVTYRWYAKDRSALRSRTRDVIATLVEYYGAEVECVDVGVMTSMFDTRHKCWQSEETRTRVKLVVVENTPCVEVVFDHLP